MANRVDASIRLGGVMPRTLFDKLVGFIHLHRLSTEWDGPPFDGAGIPVDGPLELMAHEVAGGCFWELEEFCTEHGLPFARWSEAYPGEWDAERIVFDGTGEPRSYVVTEADQVVLNQGEIRTLGSLEAIEEYFAAAAFVIPPLALSDGESDRG